MDTNATPSKRPNYSRPTKYPARLALMLTTEQRATIDDRAHDQAQSLGDVTRALLDDGLLFVDVTPETRSEITRLAREANTSEPDAVARLLDFAVRESRRRVERNTKAAY